MLSNCAGAGNAAPDISTQAAFLLHTHHNLVPGRLLKVACEISYLYLDYSLSCIDYCKHADW